MELKELKGIGKITLEKLNNVGIYTIDDLIYNFPKNYVVYESSDNIYDNFNNIFITGIVDSKIQMFRFRGKTYVFSFYIKWRNERVLVKYFSTIYVGVTVKQNMQISLYGKYNSRDKYFSCKKLFLSELEFKIENEYKINDLKDSKYKSLVISYFNSNPNINDTLPKEIIDKYKLLNNYDYIYKSHDPKTKDDLKEVIRRRKYEEFYWYSMKFEYIRSKRFNVLKKNRNIDYSLIDDVINNLDYKLTNDQLKAINDIKDDFMKDYSMNRIIQGDVGSGKTIISIISSLLIAKSGYQVSIMCPTEILANQHLKSFKEVLNKYNLDIELYTSSLKAKDKYEINIKLREGKCNIVIGTHALIYDNVIFNKLGLVVIDEQHRFGVEQRLKLINKFENVDSLFLSATPIPRTLGLTLYSDLDITSIKEMPKGRKNVITKILNYNNIDSLMKSIKNHINMGESCYVVCPLVNDNNELDYMDIYSCKELFLKYFDDNILGLIYGKMKSVDKDNVIANFKSGRIKILISTTVIEVGINVKSATMMIIMDSDLFGLSTLHQLRGRVGRNDLQSYCILVTNKENNERLNALVKYNDGFNISEMDFKLRGPGNYLGESQSGFNSLPYVSFENDINILKCAKEDSKIYFKEYNERRIKSNKYERIINDLNIEINKMN